VIKSPIFDPVTGFGGDGVPGTYTLPSDPKNESAVLIPFPDADAFFYKGCVQDGPFKDWVVHLGPGRMIADHCLVRGIQEMFRYAYTTAHVEETLRSKTYEEFRTVIDDMMFGSFGIHGSGHALVGGKMTNTYSAGAGEPRSRFSPSRFDRIHRPTFLPPSRRAGPRLVAVAKGRPYKPPLRYLRADDSRWVRYNYPRLCA
jgi:tyrosinase